ncbi:tRNA cyclic N6-threonylcarbamoyladenosine(37) synthase TcdA [Aliidiomarina iranensis]|uniref:tRNA threonylcarbamoyladenosine dehydratase n=1 Tax=Aliidiomarina iranensis TaxID=1434071 RepID=A0A432W311_9GAMM|nr:tRNA cyclic N6-threonylcarbamoyladenosine(37) synthase TcdA [Aliidiomarina iranensis]RUO23605.1 tRNA cyclic N6-threonylcarbamoyladenosine(37) synthase TcdA [Aliidiomarina iranensis]
MSAITEWQRRFSGIERLYGVNQAAQIAKLHITVIGLGGVGSWAAEALVRTGIGEITLIDLDEVCLSNVNRQSHALSDTVGQLKTEVLAQRLLAINPALKVHVVDDFINQDNLAACLTPAPDGVLDAIDSLQAKVALLAWCKRQKLPVVTTGGAGGQIDPTKIALTDVAKVIQDPLMAKVRNQLRRDYGFSRNPKRKFGIDCVYSTEQLRYPDAQGCVSYAKPGETNVRIDCSTGFGASMMVTASFGMFAAARLLEKLLPKTTPSS